MTPSAFSLYVMIHFIYAALLALSLYIWMSYDWRKAADKQATPPHNDDIPF